MLFYIFFMHHTENMDVSSRQKRIKEILDELEVLRKQVEDFENELTHLYRLESEEIAHQDLKFLPLSPDLIERYSRQILVPGFGAQAQIRLSNAKVLIIGAGGLGCPAALYLAGAGISKIGLVDTGEPVETSNLHRQIAYRTSDVGKEKCHSLSRELKKQNDKIDIEIFPEPISPQNAGALVERFDLVLDCTDNVFSRYLINDACVTRKRPLVSGSSVGLDGQLTVYGDPEDETCPCYRCIFPVAPPPSCVSTCDTNGVIGPAPGVIGTLQALEALKILGKIENSKRLTKRMLLFDGSQGTFRTVKLRNRNEACAACGEAEDENSQVPYDLTRYDYSSFCQMACTNRIPNVPDDWRISVVRLSKKMGENIDSLLVVDVRSKQEFDMCRLIQSINIPIDKFEATAHELIHDQNRNKEDTIIVLCHRGNDSRIAVDMLRSLGYNNAYDVVGGLAAWHRDVDPTFPEY